ncbi:MAG: hypothetical protein H6R17_1769 [Proteobacteria bacterium]|nr:hypothetical protein [Pseudomonadota bacterium]
MSDQIEATETTRPVRANAFFLLSDCHELFQRRLADIVRQSGISAPAVIDAFRRAVGEAHDELTSAEQPRGFEQAAGLTASRITLVDYDHLELEIRIGKIAQRLRENELIDRWRVQLRYMTLLSRPKMAATANPVGLEPICRGLWAICMTSKHTLAQNLDQLERLEQQLQQHLPAVYSELDELLERHDVEPAQAQIVRRASTGKPGAAQGLGGAGGGGSGGSGAGGGPAGCAGFADRASGANATNALSILQQAVLQQRFARAEETDRRPEGTVTVDDSTRQLLDQLIEQLSARERQQASTTANEPATGAMPRAFSAKDVDLPPDQPAAIALDTLSLIFEALFATPELPAAIKAAIGQLQVPLFKVAVADASFFDDCEHPARRLVNRIARAAIGLLPDSGSEHPLCASLAKIAQEARTTLAADDGDLSPALAAIDELIERREQSLIAGAPPLRQLLVEHETRQGLAHSTQDWLFNALGKASHAQIARFLCEHWLQVMQLAFIKGGVAGGDWKECADTADQLLASVRPQQSVEERRRLLALIPSLLKRINAGLDHLIMPSTERTLFLNTCFHLQTAAQRNRPDAQGAQPYTRPAAPPPAAPTASEVAAAPALILEHGGQRVRYLGLPTAVQSAWRSGDSTGKEGDWISFLLPDGERRCGLHCGQVAPTGTVLLCNEQWAHALAIAPALLEPHARIVSASSLFDDAANRALALIKTR